MAFPLPRLRAKRSSFPQVEKHFTQTTSIPFFLLPLPPLLVPPGHFPFGSDDELDFSEILHPPPDSFPNAPPFSRIRYRPPPCTPYRPCPSLGFSTFAIPHPLIALILPQRPPDPNRPLSIPPPPSSPPTTTTPTYRHATRRPGDLQDDAPPQAGYDVLGHAQQGGPIDLQEVHAERSFLLPPPPPPPPSLSAMRPKLTRTLLLVGAKSYTAAGDLRRRRDQVDAARSAAVLRPARGEGEEQEVERAA